MIPFTRARDAGRLRMSQKPWTWLRCLPRLTTGMGSALRGRGAQNGPGGAEKNRWWWLRVQRISCTPFANKHKFPSKWWNDDLSIWGHLQNKDIGNTRWKREEPFPPGHRPRKTWSFNFDDKDLPLLDRDLLLLGPCGWHSVFNKFRSVF